MCLWTWTRLRDPSPPFTRLGMPELSHGSGRGVTQANGEDLRGLSISSQSSAVGRGASAFNRTDCNPTVSVSLPHAARIALMWDTSTTGVAHAGVFFRYAITLITIADGSVFAYSTPMSALGRTVTMLPAGGCHASIPASSPCIARGSASAIASHSPNAYLEVRGRADITDDGAVNGMYLAVLLAAWGMVPVRHTCDLNRDGAVSGTDLAARLAGW